MRAKKIIQAIPGARTTAMLIRTCFYLVTQGSLRTILFAPPGHFYSPLPNLKDFRRREREVRATQSDIKGIDLNEGAQIEILNRMEENYNFLPFSEEKNKELRYYYNNRYFSYADGISLFLMMKLFSPGKIIEVGSGFSSAVMLDASDVLNGIRPELTFIEPFPSRLYNLFRREDRDRCEVIKSKLQDVDLELFNDLSENDFLFIDSSHVSKYGSDVNYILFDILPSISSGVIIHFHDIFWPFDYPHDWISDGRSWNEAYILRAFLQFNKDFEILYFNSYMGVHHESEVSEKLPLCARNFGGSLWLVKK
ncbi:MAG: class I SAM-dependent methyltransferase [Rhodobacteraceae bacterium]|nr:class I SAM-dependent methyltransferase [Paracoccaceae bacterium]